MKPGKKNEFIDSHREGPLNQKAVPTITAHTANLYSLFSIQTHRSSIGNDIKFHILLVLYSIGCLKIFNKRNALTH